MPPAPDARLAQALAPDLVGRRVVVRHRLPDGGLTDVVGELLDWSGGALLIRTGRGENVRVAQIDVAGGKEVPPGADADIASLERAAALGWIGLEEERLGGWVLRAAGGFTGRANSALPLGDPGIPLPDALTTLTAWYGKRGLTPRIQVPLPFRADLDAHLAAHGWRTADDVLVLTAPVRAALGRAHVEAPLTGVRVAAEPDAAWLGRYRYRGGELPAIARQVLVGGEQVAFLTVPGPEAALAVARGAVTSDPQRPARRWVGVTAVDVDPAARRQRLGTRVVAATLAWGAERGATWAYLQVSAENTLGLAFYASLGFREHHRYRYRTAPA